MDEILSHYERYFDEDSLLQPYSNPQRNSSGNGLLYTSFYIIYLYKSGLISLDHINIFRNISLAGCQVEAGLFKRAPTKYDQEGIDDYIGISTACYVLKTREVIDIYNYGKANDWVFNNVVPGKFSFSSWFGRFPQFVAHLHYCAGVEPSFFLRLYLAGSIFLSALAPKNHHDQRTLSWLMIQACYGKSKMIDLAAKFWYKRLNSLFPGGMREVFKDYFQNADHPLSKYFID